MTSNNPEYGTLWRSLLHRYDAGEAQAVVRLLCERVYGLSLADLLTDGLCRLPEARRQELAAQVDRLAQGEPVQYVMGEASFCGRWYRVSPAVLIPRPETAELCRWVVGRVGESTPRRILDVGTGSGCIACTMAAAFPGAATVAWDISDEALAVARDNARDNAVSVTFERRDALAPEVRSGETWDLIVSNPPYIAPDEQPLMEPLVVDHEPHQALFVPEDRPLCFYEAIGRYSRQTLTRGGSLFFEINPRYADDLCRLMADEGFSDIILQSDQYGRQRFLHLLQP